jgi:hypothetical protein
MEHQKLWIRWRRITGMAMKKSPVMIPLSDRVPGRASGPSWIWVDDEGGLQYFSWIDVWALMVFLMKWIYRRKGEVGGRPRCPNHRVARLGGGLHHHQVWPPPGSSPSLIWTPSSCQVNRNFGFYFVQFREHFMYNFSEIQKQQKTGTSTVASC